MSTDTQKADSIAFHFYTKLFYVVNHARATAEPRVPPKTDKWFNLESPDSELFSREDREPYRSLSTSAQVPPLEIQVLLMIPELTNNQVLVYQPATGARRRMQPTPKEIVLETWTLTHEGTSYGVGLEEISLPRIYKHGIPLFRSLYSLLRILPAWKVHKKLRRHRNQGNFAIHLRVNSPAPSPATSVLSTSAPPEPLQTSSHVFPPVPLTSGTLMLSATYLTSPVFYLDDLESLLSSRFLSLDDGLVPTLAARSNSQHRDPSSSSPNNRDLSPAVPGSVPIRTPLPHRSPPHQSDSTSSIADRFIIPRSRTPSFPGSQASPSLRNISLPPSTSGSPSLRQQPYTPPSRLRTVSSSTNPAQTTINAALSSPVPAASAAAMDTGSVGARRPQINPIHPFKSSTLSSSPSPHIRSPSSATRGSPGSFNRGSPLTGLAGINSDRRSLASEGSDSVSSIGLAGGVGTSVGSIGPSTAGVGPRGTTRKRYSSSFGHRYTGSTGMPISAGAADGRSEFLQGAADDDDISVFVHDIDRRRPLRSQSMTSQSTPVSPFHRPLALPPVSSPSSPSSPPATEVLRTESAVDERLRKMNEMFEASLVGLGSGASGSGAGTVRRRRDDLDDDTVRESSHRRTQTNPGGGAGGVGLLFGGA